jgi:spore germination protein KC
MSESSRIPRLRTDAKISYWQLFALLSVSALFTQTAALPEMRDYSMSRFITLSASTFIMFLLFVPLFLLARKRGNLLNIKPKAIKWIIAIALTARLLYGAIYGAVGLKIFVASAVLTYITPIFFVIILFAGVLYGSLKGVQASARIAPVALVTFVGTIIAVSLMLIPQIDIMRLYSPFGDLMYLQNQNLFDSILTDVLHNDELFYFIALSGLVRAKTYPDLTQRPQCHKSVVYYLPLVLISSLWLNFLYNTVLGRFIDSVPYPLYTVSTVSEFNIVERKDGVVSSIIIISGLLKIVVAFTCVRVVLGEMIHRDMTSRKPVARFTTVGLVAGAATIAFLMTGCEDYAAFTRSEQRVIVQLTGIDYEDDMYTVSVQFITGGSSDEGQDTNAAKTVSAQGRNIYSAIRQVQSDIGMELFFGHNQLVLLGEGVFTNDGGNAISALEGYFTHTGEHMTAYVAGAFGTAENVLSQTYTKEISPGNRLLLILKNAKTAGVFPVYSIYETLNNTYSTSCTFFLPMLKVEKTETDGLTAESATSDPKIVPFGGAILLNGRFVALSDYEQSAGLSLLANTSVKPGVEFSDDDDNSHTLEKFKARTHITPYYNADGLAFHVAFSAIVDKSYSHYQDIEELKEPATVAIEELIRRGLETFTDFGGDIIGLEDTLRYHEFAAWRELASSQESWQNAIRNAEFTISVKLTII